MKQKSSWVVVCRSVSQMKLFDLLLTRKFIPNPYKDVSQLELFNFKKLCDEIYIKSLSQG
jgi:hypothetical protein